MHLRDRNLSRLEAGSFDALIVGAGINGAVSAAALSGHGATVALIDQGDFAGYTSQESSNLAWGGIKYLESGEIALVHALCKSRNRLLAAYPSSIREMRFFTTPARGIRRSRWALFIGAWFYWLMGRCFTRGPRLLNARDVEREAPEVIAQGLGGIEYSDAIVSDTDARFVFGFVRSALDRGAAAANYVKALGSERTSDGFWLTRVRDELTGRILTIRSRLLINACGPGVEAMNRTNGIATRHRHIFSKGVHLIVNRIGDSKRVLAFFADDGRLFFVIPFGAKSCIGTTDTRVTELPPFVTPDDRKFILDNINKRLRHRKLTEADIIAERCGVRPLAVDNRRDVANAAEWTALSRKHAVELDRGNRHISIFGGKITDCLNIGDEILAAADELGLTLLRRHTQWYGEPPISVKSEYDTRVKQLGLDAHTPTSANEPLSVRLWRRYGSNATLLLDDIARDSRMTEIVIEGTDLMRCELHYMAQHELVTSLDDLLRRRTTIAQVMRRDDLVCARGLLEACRILFGERAPETFVQYFAAGSAIASDVPQRERA